MKILVVDDNAQNVYQLQVLLSASGYTVDTATNGAEALKQARQNPPDLIISDILMPVMDGFSLCREWMLDERLKHVPLVFYTATYTDGQDQKFAADLGAAQFIIKPEEPEILLQKVEAVIANKTRDKPAPPEKPMQDETVYLKQYSETLIRKLEDTNEKLEQANQQLERDLVELKRRDEALQFRNILLSTQQEASIDGILVVDENGRILSHNRRFVELWGLPAKLVEEKIDERLLQYITAQVVDSQAFLEQVRYLYDHRPEISQDEINLKDGRVFDRYSAPMFGPDNRYYGRVWSFRDTTARRLAERQLRERNEILSNSHEGVMIVDLTNTVSFWNHGAEEIFGWTAAEALGGNPAQLMGVDDLGAMTRLLTAVERDGHWNGELRALTRDGRKLIVESRVTLVRDEAGRPRARLNFLADITETKLLEEKFLHAQRLESIGMLAAGIAHDLNNVLAPILFAAPLLRTSLSAPRDMKILNTLEQSAGRGAGLVKQILGFAHTTSGELRPTQVKHLVRDIINLIEETFPKSIQLEQQIPTNLWPVQGNATQIHQVLLNLCVNARDAMPSGGTLRIVADNRRLDAAAASAMPDAHPGDWLMIEVSDTGTGIAPEVQERIWTPFFTTKSVGKGTGLGLSTVRTIVLNHHGLVELDTKVGRGTTFRVFLPAVEHESPRSGSAAPFAMPAGHGELILVVDDDKVICSMVSEILTTNGYRVVSCANGEEAMVLFSDRASEIAAVITDVDMPRLDGATLTRALLQMRPDIRLIAMSGLSGDGTEGADVAEVQKWAHAFLPKPFKPDALLGAVHRLLQTSAQS